MAEHGLEGLRSDEPAMELRPSLSQRILKSLFRSRPESIQGQGKTCDSDTPHTSPLDCLQHAALLNQCLQSKSMNAASISGFRPVLARNRPTATHLFRSPDPGRRHDGLETISLEEDRCRQPIVIKPFEVGWYLMNVPARFRSVYRADGMSVFVKSSPLNRSVARFTRAHA